MPDPQIRASFYLSPTIDHWWRWGEDAQVLTWADDRTIAFAPEVRAVLARLAPGGLPPFGAVSLLLAAARDGWAQSPGRALIEGYARILGRTGITHGGSGTPMEMMPHGTIGRMELLLGLDAVGQLPKELCGTPEGKGALAELVFEGLPGRGEPADADLILRALDAGLSPGLLRPQLSHDETIAQFVREVRGLAEGLSRVDAEALRRRMTTGIELDVRPAGAEVPPPQRVRQLLAELRADPELSPLANLARDLMAAVSVPRTLRVHEDMPVGGAADLSNRGPLDRLLLSELAHDDLTLAVRVALNEALYLRRESPPREPPHCRAILLDAGVRMWGVPRVFATAVALALAATHDPKAAINVFRAAGDGVAPVDLTTRAGLEAHLAALETAAHPGRALASFLDAARSPAGAATPATPLDAFVITHADAAADADFVAAVRALNEPSIYVASVDRAGAFNLAARTRAGEKPIRAAKLSLDAVLAQPKNAPPGKRPGVPLIRPDVDRHDLPAILFAEPFPLLLPHAADPARSAASVHGLFTVTPDGRLLHWRDGGRGARQLTASLPRGALHRIAVDEATGAVHVLITPNGKSGAVLVVAEADGEPCRQFPIEMPVRRIVQAFVWAGLLYIVHERQVDAFSMRDGGHQASINLPPGARWANGRFFRWGNRHCVVTYDGSAALRWEQVAALLNTRALFDRAGYERPWAVTDDWKVVHPDGGARVALGPTFSAAELLGTSRDGKRLAFKGFDPLGNTLAVDLDEPRKPPQRFRGEAWRASLLEPHIHWSRATPSTLRSRFGGIFVDSQSRLALMKASSRSVAAQARTIRADGTGGGPRYTFLNNDGNGITLADVCSIYPSNAPPRLFTVVKRLAAGLPAMYLASWPDGSRAWLDGRGLLHLKSSDPRLPELTLVLRHDPHHAAAPTAAWSSDGKVCGPPFFIGDARPEDPGYFMELIGRFVQRLQ